MNIQLNNYKNTGMLDYKKEYTEVERELQSVMQELQTKKMSTLSNSAYKGFKGSVNDIQLYTGLQSYNIILKCLYRILSHLSPLSTK